MTTKHIIFALGISMAACSSGAMQHQSVAPISHDECAGGFVWNDRDLARYEGCEAIAGDLVVKGVSSLEPLSSLKSVDGTLRVADTTKLYSFRGLEKLQIVGALEVQNNKALISLGGLKSLTMAERVLISKNPRLSGTFGLLPELDRNSAKISVDQNAGLYAEGISFAYSHLADSRLAKH
jgi:hypothetical protein